MALIAAVPAFLIPVASRSARISAVVILCGIPLMIGVMGINGDPVSVVIRNARKWYKTRGVMLYNDETTALKTAAITAMMNEKRASDTLVDLLENFKANREAKRDAEVYIKGVTFEFAEDPYMKDLYADKLYADEGDEMLDDAYEELEVLEYQDEQTHDLNEEPEISISLSDDDEEDFF